jgi:hypothetical protein
LSRFRWTSNELFEAVTGEVTVMIDETPLRRDVRHMFIAGARRRDVPR